jgi:hypothetical protein
MPISELSLLQKSFPSFSVPIKVINFFQRMGEPDFVLVFSHMLREATGAELSVFAKMVDREILNRAHLPPSSISLSDSITASDSTTASVDSLLLQPAPQRSTLEKVMAKPKGPIKQLPPRVLETDEDGFHHMRVCDSARCDPDYCLYSYRLDEFPLGWIPSFRNKDTKTGKTTEGCVLIAYDVDPYASWETSRYEIVKYLGKVRTASISVREGDTFAFIVCFSHSDAVKAKKSLIENGDYTVKFVCTNLHSK